MLVRSALHATSPHGVALAALVTLTTSVGCTTTSTDRASPPTRSSPVLTRSVRSFASGAFDIGADATYSFDGLGVTRARDDERERFAPLDTPLPIERVASFAVGDDESVWVVTSDPTGPRLTRWDGSAWRRVALPNGAVNVAVDARSIDDVWISLWSFDGTTGDDSLCRGVGPSAEEGWDCDPITSERRPHTPALELTPSFAWTIDADGVVHRRAADGTSETIPADDCIGYLRPLDDEHVFAVACGAIEGVGTSPPHPALTFDGTGFVAMHPTAQFVQARSIDDVWLVEADQGFVSTTSGGGCLPTWGCSDRMTYVDSAWRQYVVLHDDGSGFVEVGHADFLTRSPGGASAAGIFPLGAGHAFLILEGWFEVTAP